MKKLQKFFFLIMVIATFGLSWPFSWLFSHTNPEQFGTSAWIQKQVQILERGASNIDPQVLRLSLVAYINARKHGVPDNKGLLTVIDYSKPSNEKRLWVFDLKNGRTLFNTWVAHGKNSGGTQATSFSNGSGSLKSSLGVFVTDIEPYIGGKGIALRLKGLERGVNDHAYSRDIVVHGAWYVNADTIRKYGQVGRSWGCPAVSADLAKPLIDTIKDKTLVFAYYPDRNWLNHSPFLASY